MEYDVDKKVFQSELHKCMCSQVYNMLGFFFNTWIKVFVKL